MQRLSANILKNGIQKKQKDNPKVQERWEELNDGGNIIFGMRDHYAQDDEEIQKHGKIIKNE